ncbi:MAG: hypothetical protein WBD20_17835 [Pirellulaceae bacterium]
MSTLARCASFCFRCLLIVALTNVAASAQTIEAVVASAANSFKTETIALPPNPADTKGYTVEFTWNKQIAPGYMSLSVLVKSTSTFAADQQITVRMEPVKTGHSPSQNGMTIDLPITIDQGAKQKVVTRLVPKWSTGNAYKLRVFDGGAERKDYETEIGELLRNRRRANTEALQSDFEIDWLVVCDDESEPSIRSFLDGKYPRTSSVSNGRASQAEPSPVKRASIAPSDLPTDWRGLQSFDAVVIQQSELQELAKQSPQRFTALRDWMLCGGTVIVFDAESRKSPIEALRIGFAPDVQSDWIVSTQVNTIATNHRASMYTIQDSINSIVSDKEALKNPTANGYGMQNGYGMMTSLTPQQMDAQLVQLRLQLSELNTNHPSRLIGQQIWLQRAGGGQVIGIDQANKLDSFSLSVVARTFGYRQSPMLRRGVDPLIGDQRVRRWLIPGVAQPPVYTFMGLLTLFVVLVGPVAYRKTTKSGRGYLMFAIAPILALLTTAMMLIYGVVADGFGTQTRIRQLTWVDGASGDAAERIRGTYFSGVRPIDGLSFGADAEVMVYPDRNDESWETLNQKDSSTMGVVTVSEKRQQFDSSYMPSRAQTQFVVHRPRHQIGQLRLGRPQKVGQTVTLSNEFDFELRNVVIRDRQGDYWWLENLAADAKNVACNRATPNAASKMLGNLYNDHRPIAATRESGSNAYRNRTRDLISMTNLRTGDQTRSVTDGAFEFWLQQTLQVAGELQVGHFIALADVTDDAVWVKDAAKVASVRFVFGTLP